MSASASSLPFQICQCAKRYSAIAEASARRYPPPTPQIVESYRIEWNRIEHQHQQARQVAVTQPQIIIIIILDYIRLLDYTVY